MSRLLYKFLFFLLISAYFLSISHCEQQQQQDCLSSIQFLETSLGSLTHFKSWEDSNQLTTSLNIINNSIQDIYNKCSICSANIQPIAQQISDLKIKSQQKEWMFVIQNVFGIIQDVKTLENTCQASFQITEHQSCVDIILNLKKILKQLTQFENLEYQSLRDGLLNSLLTVTQSIDKCLACAVTSDFSSLKSSVSNIIEDAKKQQWLDMIKKVVAMLEDVEEIYKCAEQKQFQEMGTQFIVQESCTDFMVKVKDNLYKLNNINYLKQAVVRDQVLNTLEKFVGQFENSCKQYIQDAIQLKDSIVSIINDSKHQKWVKLLKNIGETIGQIEQLLKLSNNQIEMNLSFSIWCEDAIGNVKKALQQLTDIKNLKSPYLRENLLANLVSVVVGIDKKCSQCQDQQLNLKNAIFQIIADAKQKNWEALVETVIQVLKQADTVYECVKGKSSAQQEELLELETSTQQPSQMQTQQNYIISEKSCANSILSIKQTLKSLTELKNVENSDLRGNLFSDLASVLVGIEGACKPCVDESLSIKNEVLQLIADSRQQNWISLIQEVAKVIGDADKLYKCVNGGSMEDLEKKFEGSKFNNNKSSKFLNKF